MSRQVDVKALISHIVKGDGLDKCRICMGDTSQGHVHLTDTVMMDGEKAVTLSELLELISGIEIQEELECPNGVCVACASAALAAEEFRLFVLSAESLWQRAVKNLSQLPYDASDKAKSLCALISPNVTVDIHSDFDGGDATTVLNRVKTKIVKRHVRKPRTFRNGPNVSCPDCHKEFSSPHLLQTHLQNSDRMTACGECGLVVVKGQELKRHLISEHNKPALLCKDCPTVVLSETELKIHRSTAHKPGALNCVACGRTFTRKVSYDSHIQMHIIWTCRSCETQFSNRSCYRQHRSTCEPNAKPKTTTRVKKSNNRDPSQFVCDYCQKMYSSRPQLKNHILWIHLDHRPHQCAYCGKRFYTSARLNEHLVVHTRVRKYECDLCDAKLVSKSAAIYHRRRHTGEKPYVCDDCGAAFISSSRRLEHAKRIHNKGVRFKCPECPSSFVRRKEVEKHAEKHHKTIITMDQIEKGSLSELFVTPKTEVES